MKKVLKFVKGKRDDKREYESDPFSFEIPVPSQQQAAADEDHVAVVDPGYGYKLDFTGKDKSINKLHKAAWQGNLEKIKVNVKKIDIDSADRYNRTPLHLAASQGHVSIVWFLLGNRANTNICDKEGKTPFLKAVECGQKEAVNILLESGADINTVDYGGNSALHIAARQGFYEIASMLLKRGANFEDSNNTGEFPLHIATQSEHRELVELLLRYGASVNVVDRENRSPLMFAAKSGNTTLVQLFLEYGAQSAVMDSNDYTAEDYAMFGGHHDIATQLKSPSEAISVSFPETSSELKKLIPACAIQPETVTPQAVDSVKEGDASLSEKKSEEADNSEAWNDSVISDLSDKQKEKVSKLSQFIPQSSEEDASETSVQSPRVREEQDSPRSCVIPPPCKPPRSWDLIQSGVIDDPMGSEPRLRSLLKLGSLRSKRESFTDSASGTGSPIPLSDSSHTGQGDGDQWAGHKFSQQKGSSVIVDDASKSWDSPSTKYEDIQVKKTQPQTIVDGGGDAENQQKNDWDADSSSDSDFDSDDSLPLDNFEAEEKMLGINVKQSEEDNEGIGEGDVIDYSNAPTLEKKGRFLPRGSSIDLTDSSCDSRRDKSKVYKPSDKVLEDKDENISKEKSTENQALTSDSGTLGRDGTMLGYEEVWEPIVQVHAQTVLTPPKVDKVQPVSSVSPPLPIPVKSKSCDKQELSTYDIVGSRLAVQEDNLLFSSPRPGQKIEGTESTGANKKVFDGKYESRSLDDFLDDSTRNPNSWMETKVIRPKRHSRQQSVSVLSWTQSEKVQQKPPDVAEINRAVIDSKRIKEQLECYDEALRELAQVKLIKKHQSSSLPPTRGSSEAQLSLDKGQGSMSLPVGHELPHSTIVKKQGSLSLPRTNEAANLMRASSLGTPNPSSFISDNLGRELAHAAIVRKQGSLSLPRSSEIPNLQKAQTTSLNKEEYLSLPRSNELIDEAFKEIGKSTITTNKRGSRSLPRSITPKAMEMEADPVPPPRNRRFLRNRRRAESESEAVSRRSKESVKSQSFDVKLHTPKVHTNVASLKAEEKASSSKAPCSEGSETSSLSKESEASTLSKDSSIEKPIKKKRKMLLAMRGLIAPSLKALSDHHKSKETSDESFEEPPFWMSRDKDSGLGRQSTVVEKANVSSNESNPMKLSPRLSHHEEVTEENIISVNVPVCCSNHADIKYPQVISSNASQSKPSLPLPVNQMMSVPLDSLEVGLRSPSAIIRDCQSDAESIVSLNEITPQHDYIKNHHALLKSHLHAATLEKGRLEETAAELGEKAEKLKYELADAHEATRSRDEVISLLENQLTSLEEKYTLCLDEMQRFKLSIGNQEQEIQHLKEIRRRDEEDKVHLNEIIKLKETENSNLEKLLATKLEGKSNNENFEKDQIEFQVHLKYLEEEKARLNNELGRLQTRLDTVQKKLETTMEKNQSLIEEKAELFSKMSGEIMALQEESRKWKHMYESSEEKLRHLDSNLACTIESKKTSEDQEQAQAYKKDLKDILEKVEKLKEKDSVVWQNKIKEEVNNAVLLLRTEYDKVENTISRHNSMLEKLVLQLQSDLEVSSKKQEDMASQLSQTQSELTDARQYSEELAHLREVATMVDQLRVVNSELQERLHKVEDMLSFRDAELQEKTGILEKLKILNQEQAEALDELELIKQENKKLIADLDKCKKKNFSDVMSQTESIMFTKKVNNQMFEHIDREGEIEECDEEIILEKLQNENMELRDLLSIKNDQLSKMVEKTNSLVKHNERIKHQLLELKEKQNINKLDKATMSEIDVGKSYGSIKHTNEAGTDVSTITREIDGVAAVQNISEVTNQLHIIKAILQAQEQELMLTKTCNWTKKDSHENSEFLKLVNQLRKENSALSETVNNILGIHESALDRTHNLSLDNKQQNVTSDLNVEEHGTNKNAPPVTIYMSVGLPPSAHESKSSVHIKNDGNNKVGINCCMYVDSKSKVISVDNSENIDSHALTPVIQSQEISNLRKKPDLRNENVIDVCTNFHSGNECGFSKYSVHSKEKRENIVIKETSSPFDSSGEEYSNVMEIQATVHHDADAKEGLCDVRNPADVSSSSSSDIETEKKLQKLKIRPHVARDASTNTLPSSQNYELQKELILEREKSKKYQQNFKKLKSEVELLRANSLTENNGDKTVKLEANLSAKQNNTSSLVGGLLSPGRYDHNVVEFHKQVSQLEKRLKDENSKRFALEMQVNKMKCDLQEKVHLEKELWRLRGQLEKDYVSRYELDQLRRNYELALNHAKKEAQLLARDDINSKISQINSFIEKQVQEQIHHEQLRNSTEAQMRQEFHDTRAKLLSELSRVQAMLEMNGEEEKELREKCEKLVRECDKTQDMQRRKLIEKSYSVNLATSSKSKEIKSPVHRSVTVTSLPVAPVSDTLSSDNSLGHILRRELEKTIRKHTDTLSDEPCPSIAPTTTDEHLEILRRKYFLH